MNLRVLQALNVLVEDTRRSRQLSFMQNLAPRVCHAPLHGKAFFLLFLAVLLGGAALLADAGNAHGNRVRKTVIYGGDAVEETHYLVEDRNPTGYAQVMEERGPNGDTVVKYVYGLDLISQARSGATHYYGYDGLGSVRYLTDANGAVTDTYTYDAFGIQIADSGVGTANAYHFAGEHWDADLEMLYLRARWYKPEFGRFWTMDSYEGNQSDPLSLHKYLYCHADPVNGVDPSGHEFNMIGLMAATGIQMYLRSVYDTVVLSTGFAMEKTILGVQAGKTAEAIVLEYTVETVIGGVAGFALGKVIGRALDLGDAVPPATGLFKNPEPIRLPLGTRVYRVYLPKNPTSQIYGRFWTTVDPRKVANFADAAGLPQHVAQALRNGEAKLLVGRVINNENVLGRAAENIGGNRGGLFEVQFPNAPSQVQVLDEVPFQQMW